MSKGRALKKQMPAARLPHRGCCWAAPIAVMYMRMSTVDGCCPEAQQTSGACSQALGQKFLSPPLVHSGLLKTIAPTLKSPINSLEFRPKGFGYTRQEARHEQISWCIGTASHLALNVISIRHFRTITGSLLSRRQTHLHRC